MFGTVAAEWRNCPDVVRFEGVMEAFNPRVTWRRLRTSTNVLRSTQANKVLEVRDELGAVIRDVTGCHAVLKNSFYQL